MCKGRIGVGKRGGSVQRILCLELLYKLDSVLVLEQRFSQCGESTFGFLRPFQGILKVKTTF